MSFVLIDRPQHLDDLARALETRTPLALDCEAAGFHRYSDSLCLLQVTTHDGTDYVIDPLALEVADVLRPALEDPAVQIVMHGADYDIRLLDRDLDIHPRGLFDTQVAAALLGEPALGLAALLERHLGVSLQKKYQRADWARRPLPSDMLQYAASDTRHLHGLAARLLDRLKEKGRLTWAQEEFGLLEEVRWADESALDPVTRVKGARDLSARESTSLREALRWRDEIARTQDRAPFRVVQDRTLLDIVVAQPATVEALATLKGVNPRLAREAGPELLARLGEVQRLAPGALEAYPRAMRNGRGRLTPVQEDRVERLKAARNARADVLGIARGTLLPNTTLVEIARLDPRGPEDLTAVSGLKRWQAEATADALLGALKG